MEHLWVWIILLLASLCRGQMDKCHFYDYPVWGNLLRCEGKSVRDNLGITNETARTTHLELRSTDLKTFPRIDLKHWKQLVAVLEEKKIR